MVIQLKSSVWTPSNDNGFYNTHFTFYKATGGEWQVKIRYDSYYDSSYIQVSEFINSFYFWYLRRFYVNRLIRNHKVFEKEANLAIVSEKFFQKNKDLSRDAKLDQLLNK